MHAWKHAHVCGYVGKMEEDVGSPGAVTHLVRVLGAELGSSDREQQELLMAEPSLQPSLSLVIKG